MRVGLARIAVLLPYALAAIAVVVASAVALGMTVRPPAEVTGIPVATREPTATRVPMSSDARMTYWRTGTDGVMELWASDLDGDRRFRLGRQARDADIALTRWAPDGSAVAYTVGGTLLEMAWLDVTHARVQMPANLRTARWRIVSYEWSLDAKRIAATFRAGGGLSNESDVWVTDASSSALWDRVTTLGDAYAGPWIDEHRLFIETSSGLIAVLDLRTKELKPVTAQPSVSPQLGRDGRVWFIGGGTVTADIASQPVATGWVWSATIDGEELRRETSAEHGQARLFGVMSDGRPIVGVPGGVYVASEGLVPLVFAGSGSVRRVYVSDDGKRVLGLTESRILRIEQPKIPRSLGPGQLPPPDAATTLLSGIREPDVWVTRKAVAPARGGFAAPAGAPASRLAFTLGHAVWELLPEGTAKAIATERGNLLGRPAWSPTGDRVATLYIEVGERQPSALVVGPAGPVRWRLPTASRELAWSPDGRTITFWIPTGTRLDQFNTHSFDPATGRSIETTPGRAVWAGTSRVVLSDGDVEITTGTAATTAPRVGQRVEVVTATGRRTITDARRLAASSLLKDVPDAARTPLITQILPTADPDHVMVTLARLGVNQGQTRTPAHVIVRVADGEPVHVMPMAIDIGPFDLAWSPTGLLVGYGTSEILPTTGVTLRRAIVLDPLGATIRLRVDGRFAGWSPDGTWAYVARDDGLFAYRLGAEGASDPLRISPLGVVVSATRAR